MSAASSFEEEARTAAALAAKMIREEGSSLSLGASNPGVAAALSRSSMVLAPGAPAKPPPAPWARQVFGMAADGFPITIVTPAPRLPVTIPDGVEGVGLAQLITGTIPRDDRTHNQASFVAMTHERVGLERGGDPARCAQLDADLVALYPAVLEETRVRLDTPARARAFDQVQKHALEAALRVLEADAEPANSDAAPPAARAGKLIDGTVMRMALTDVIVSPERRARADAEAVTRIADSIRVIGLQNPVVVGLHGELVSGLHRLLAHAKLGLPDILVHVRGLDGQRLRLAEIDENLVRRQLSALELAELTSERKQIYETLHPETRQHRRGGAVKASRAAAAFVAVADSFAAATAQKTGMSERTVRQYTQVSKLPDAARDAVRGTPVGERINELVALTHVPAEDQVAVARVISEGKAKRVSEAYRVLQAAKGPALPYAVNQGPVVRRQLTNTKRLRDDLQATASEWRQQDPVGMNAFVDWNVTVAAMLTEALDAAPTEIPAEACSCGASPSCARCRGRGWLPAKTSAGGELLRATKVMKPK